MVSMGTGTSFVRVDGDEIQHIGGMGIGGGTLQGLSRLLLKTHDIHQVAAESDVVDFIDVEYFEAKNPQKEIAMLQEMGVYVIASHHDFEQTPDPEVIRMLLEQIRESGADVVKLAVMPQNMWDVLHLLEETNRFHENHPDHPLITMSMGAKGGISRVAGEFFGSCVTFGAGGQASAPGQLPVKQLEEILHILHQSVD